MEKTVSIVVIGRNEERSIGRCFEAALAAAEQIGGAELIYVDSRSTDNSVSIAESYGFRTVALPADMRLSPSAGRFVGSKIARGKFILFLDADTLIYRDFLPRAIAAFDHDRRLGGVNGRIDDFTEAGEPVSDVEELCDNEMDVKWLRGPCCFYRRKALIEAGSFNPELAMEEEAELGLRIINTEWWLKKIPLAMAKHTRCYHGDSLSSVFKTFARDYRANRLGEITRTISHAFISGNGVEFCWLRLKTTILFLCWLIMTLAALMLPSDFHPWKTAGLLAIIGVVALLIKKRGIYQTLIFVPSKVLNTVDILMGLHKIRIRETGIRRSGESVEHKARPTI
jgi:glycosyltransferase involved in cell wall biosynthesis